MSKSLCQQSETQIINNAKVEPKYTGSFLQLDVEVAPEAAIQRIIVQTDRDSTF